MTEVILSFDLLMWWLKLIAFLIWEHFGILELNLLGLVLFVAGFEELFNIIALNKKMLFITASIPHYSGSVAI